MSRNRHKSQWAPTPQQRQLTVIAAAAFDVDHAMMMTGSRKAPIVRARRAAMWALKQRWPQLSYAQVARAVGLSEGALAVDAVRMVQKRMDWEAHLSSRCLHLLQVDIGKPEPYTGEVKVAPKPKRTYIPREESDMVPGTIAWGSVALIEAIKREHPERITV